MKLRDGDAATRTGRYGLLVVLLLTAASCGSDPSSALDAHGLEAGGPAVDWEHSPLVSAPDPSSPEALAEFRDEAPFDVLDITKVSANDVVTYSDGISLALVLSDPTAWIIQSPLDPDGIAGLDAKNDAYSDAADSGTEVSNIVLSNGVTALRIAGPASITIIFPRGESLIQVSAPKNSGEDFLEELAATISG